MYKGKYRKVSILAYLGLRQRIKAGEWDRYTFNTSVYVNNTTKITVNCITHGEFLATPHSLKSGRGCPSCAGNLKRTHSDYLSILNIVNPTILCLGVYKNARTKIPHLHKCGHIWDAIPNSLVNGYGCPKCSTSGFSVVKPAILYYLSINKGQAYKIGVTNRTVKDRYSNSDLVNISILEEVAFPVGGDALKLEKELLSKYSEYLLKGRCLLESGNTEIFFYDILKLQGGRLCK